jgi:putative heme-binding domain-containing protein
MTHPGIVKPPTTSDIWNHRVYKSVLPWLLTVALAGAAPAAETLQVSTLDLTKCRQGWNTAKADRSVADKTLTIAGKTYANGFGTHAVSDLIIDVKGSAERFTAEAGVDDEQDGSGSVEFVLLADDKIIYRSPIIRSGDEAVKIDVTLTGVKQLVLHVTDGNDGNGNDHADWCDARIVYAGEKPEAVAIPPDKTFKIPMGPVSVHLYMPKVPKGYSATLFGKPPEVSYPVSLSASGDGQLFVSVDKNGSLDRERHRGSIIRMTDSTGSGIADHVDTFVADVDSPRGIYYDGDTLFCLHPPTLTAYRDTTGNGVADQAVDIVTGIGFGFDKHPADHTNNGIREAIDGWIYMAIGDFGIPNAKGPNGSSLIMRGGGIVRVRPDGSEIEVFAHHTRNVLDVSQDPYLNCFIYDNTNDGDGWNSRFTYAVGLSDIGYPSLYLRFGSQLLPTLADFGGGAAVGTIYIHEPGLPGTDGDSQFICDWGTSGIYKIPLVADGAGFRPIKQREEWARVERVTDMDVDGNSHIFVSSWRGAMFNNAGPNVGAIIELRPQPGAGAPAKFPNLKKMSDAELVGPLGLGARSAMCRQQTQHEILRRGIKPDFKAGLIDLLKPANPLYVRIAALFTFSQLYGMDSHETLIALTKDPTIQEWALRALADRKSQLAGVPSEPFLEGLNSPNPRVRVQALIGLARLGRPENAKDIVPLTAVKPDWQDASLVIPHTAVRALVELKNAEPVAAVISAGAPSDLVDGALWALKWMHDATSVDVLIAHLPGSPIALQKKIYDTLCHLYYTEGPWDRQAWWTTRPEHQGPYYQKATWEATPAIAAALTAGITAGGDMAAFITERITFYGLKMDGIPAPVASKPMVQTDAEILAKARAASAKYVGKVIGNIPYDDVLAVARVTPGDPKLGAMLFQRQGCIACHTISSAVPPKGPFLGEIAKQYSRAEIIESIVKPNAKIAQGFATRWFDLKNGTHLEGFVTSEGAETVTIRNILGIVTQIQVDQIVKRGEQKNSMMPEGLVNNLKPEELAGLLAFFESMLALKK